MTIAEQIITIAMCTLGTMAMRFLPFLVFRQDKPTPKYIQYLGKVLPGAIFGMLIVYCLRSVSVTEYSWGLPELIAGAATVGIHLWSAACCCPSPPGRLSTCCWCSSCLYNVNLYASPAFI